MPSLETLAAFALATSIFAYMPGPSMLYVAAQTIARGRTAGWMAALGVHVGGYVHVIAAALGLSVLFTAVPLVYGIVKLLGAAYLIWLGVQLILTKDDPGTANASDTVTTFWQSMTVEILNPKTAIFYIAFLPQFTEPMASLPLWSQLLILGTLVNIAFSSADVICVLLASSVMKWLKQSRSSNLWLQRAGGSILVFLGLRLAFVGEGG